MKERFEKPSIVEVKNTGIKVDNPRKNRTITVLG